MYAVISINAISSTKYFVYQQGLIYLNYNIFGKIELYFQATTANNRGVTSELIAQMCWRYGITIKIMDIKI